MKAMKLSMMRMVLKKMDMFGCDKSVLMVTVILQVVRLVMENVLVVGVHLNKTKNAGS